jgi:hypothetical protein
VDVRVVSGERGGSLAGSIVQDAPNAAIASI